MADRQEAHDGILVLRIELASLRQTVQHAFTERQLQLNERVSDLLEREVERFDVEAMIAEECGRVVREAVRRRISIETDKVLERLRPKIQEVVLDEIRLETGRIE